MCSPALHVVYLRRRFALALCLLLGAVLAMSGCVGVRHERLLTSADDAAAKGIRYYRASPYLLIHPDGKGSGTWQIQYLPDQSKKMSAEPFAVLAKNELTMKFVNGVLKSSEENADATAVPTAVVDALAKILPTLLAPSVVRPPAAAPPEPEIFKIIVSDKTLELRGASAARTFTTTF